MSKIINARYAVGRTLPQEKPPRGHVLAHNDIEHTARTRNGVKGFRWWTWPKDELPLDFGRCKCGWSGLPHYAPLGSKSVARVRLTKEDTQLPIAKPVSKGVPAKQTTD